MKIPMCSWNTIGLQIYFDSPILKISKFDSSLDLLLN